MLSNIAVIHEGDLSYVMLDKGNGKIERKEIKIGWIQLCSSMLLFGGIPLPGKKSKSNLSADKSLFERCIF
ncbi:hypothetical protein NST99_07805 [Paenibacillus sp. FSL L8-0470]|uniref:hypothetical protein n=2 Tax=unclassified Paenibacillus TaxID=185978 RepID=UPI0030FD204F